MMQTLNACACACAVLMCIALCGAVPMTAQEKSDVLLHHNQFRCGVSPPAASMPEMVWDTGLEAVAQAYANTCPSGHNSNRTNQYHALTGSTDYVGENIAWGYSTPAAAVDGFGNENRYYTFSSNSCASGQQCGHYTQVVWASSIRVGCAKAAISCPSWGDKVYICDYAPGGNYVGEKPYTETSSNVVTAACQAIGGTPSTVAPATTPTTAATTQATSTTAATTQAPTTTVTTRTTVPSSATTAATTAATTTPATTGATTVTTRTTTRATTTTTRITTAASYCPTSGISNTLRCKNGSTCNVLTAGWGCCASAGGRKQCPPEKPVLCAAKTCSGDYCCDSVAGLCSTAGGILRTCP